MTNSKEIFIFVHLSRSGGSSLWSTLFDASRSIANHQVGDLYDLSLRQFLVADRQIDVARFLVDHFACSGNNSLLLHYHSDETGLDSVFPPDFRRTYILLVRNEKKRLQSAAEWYLRTVARQGEANEKQIVEFSCNFLSKGYHQIIPQLFYSQKPTSDFQGRARYALVTLDDYIAGASSLRMRCLLNLISRQDAISEDYKKILLLPRRVSPDLPSDCYSGPVDPLNSDTFLDLINTLSDRESSYINKLNTYNRLEPDTSRIKKYIVNIAAMHKNIQPKDDMLIGSLRNDILGNLPGDRSDLTEAPYCQSTESKILDECWDGPTKDLEAEKEESCALRNVARLREVKELLISLTARMQSTPLSLPPEILHENNDNNSDFFGLKPRLILPLSHNQKKTTNLIYFHVPRTSGSSIWSLLCDPATSPAERSFDHYSHFQEIIQMLNKQNYFDSALLEENAGVDKQVSCSLSSATMLAASRICADCLTNNDSSGKVSTAYQNVIHVQMPFMTFSDDENNDCAFLFSIRDPDEHLCSLVRMLYDIFIKKCWHDSDALLDNLELASFMAPPSLARFPESYPVLYEEFFGKLIADSPELFSYQMRWITAVLTSSSPSESLGILWELPACKVLKSFENAISALNKERISFVYLDKKQRHRFLSAGSSIALSKCSWSWHKKSIFIDGIPRVAATISREELRRKQVPLSVFLQDPVADYNSECMEKFVAILSEVSPEQGHPLAA